VKKWRAIRSVCNIKKQLKRIVLTEENVWDIEARLKISPRKSLRRLAQKTGVARLHEKFLLILLADKIIFSKGLQCAEHRYDFLRSLKEDICPVINILDIINLHVFYLKQCLGDWTLP
jgi:hypothetical protein